jgi:hypothetical protein
MRAFDDHDSDPARPNDVMRVIVARDLMGRV